MILLDGGAKFDLRCNGYTAAGYLLLTLSKNQSSKETRFRILGQLLEKGADVHAPLYKNPDFGGLGSSLYTDIDCSDETLRDMAYLMNKHQVEDIFARYPPMPPPILTIIGIISSAEQGVVELQQYLHKATFLRGQRRNRIKEISLLRSLARPKALSSMICVGFDLRIPHLMTSTYKSYPNFNLKTSKIIKYDGKKECFAKNIEELPIAGLTDEAISLILREEGSLCAHLIRICLETQIPHIFERLFKCGLAIDAENGIVLMAEAARYGNRTVVSLLRRHNVDINGVVIRRGVAWSVLLLAITGANIDNDLCLLKDSGAASTEILNFLHELGADINTCRPISNAHLNVKTLFRIKSDIWKWLLDNALDFGDMSIYMIMTECLHWHSHSDRLELLQFLMRKEIPIFSPSETRKEDEAFQSKDHPLSYFISLNADLEIIRKVLDAGIDVNGQGRDATEKTPLQAAASQKNLEIVKELVSRGAVVNEKHCLGKHTALQLACWPSRNSPFDLVQYLLEQGADPNATGLDRRMPPLAFAVSGSSQDIRVIKLLLDRGAEANAPDHPESILCLALKAPCPIDTKVRMVDILLQHGANVNARHVNDKYELRESPIEIMCQQRGDCVDLAKLLLARGAEVNPTSWYKRYSALTWACLNGNIRLVELLLAKGADPNVCGCLAETARRCDIPIALILLNAGAKVTVSSGIYPLSSAAGAGRIDMAVLLLQRETREEALKQAISAARWYGHDTIADIIERHMDGRGSAVVEETDI